MTRTQKQRARQDRAADTTTTEEAAADLRNPELDEDTACCLAEIDCCLAETQKAAEETAEELRAARYAAARQEILDAEDESERLVLVEQHSSLGFKVSGSCCGDYAVGSDGEYLGNV